MKQTHEIVSIARKVITEGETILGRTYHDFSIKQHSGADDGPLTRAWKRGDLPARQQPLVDQPSEGQPSISDMIRMIAESMHRGRRITAGLGLIKLRERYETLDPDDLPEDERTWPGFVRKRLPLGINQVNQLIGAMVHRGDILRC